MKAHDVLIVGGSVAGAALAIALGRKGVRVLLLEKARHPRLKACGEGLLPQGVRALEPIGLPDAPRVRGLRFVAGDVSVEADFPAGFGLVLRRDRFDAWLFSKAASTANVEAREGVVYRGDESAPIIVGADGLKSMFHRLPGFDATPARPSRIGLSTHVAGLTGLRDRVEVFFDDDGEVYLAPTGGGEALVAALFNEDAFRRIKEGDGVRHLLEKIPELNERAMKIEFTTPILAVAPLGLRVKRIVGDGRLLIGDAAGAPDPITGDGMSLSLCSVDPAADAICVALSGGDCSRRSLLPYEKTRHALGRTPERLGRLLMRLGRSRRRAAWFLEKRREAVPLLLDVAVGRRPLNALTLARALL